jgi:hypothetical protein
MLIDALLAAAVLAGVVANAAAGWWWADPHAGFVIVYYGITEGAIAWQGEPIGEDVQRFTCSRAADGCRPARVPVLGA